MFIKRRYLNNYLFKPTLYRRKRETNKKKINIRCMVIQKNVKSWVRTLQLKEITCRVRLLFLTYSLFPMHPFSSPKNIRKPYGFLMFSGGREKGEFQIILSVSLQKSIFSLLLEYFFCLINIHTCCNQ